MKKVYLVVLLAAVVAGIILAVRMIGPGQPEPEAEPVSGAAVSSPSPGLNMPEEIASLSEQPETDWVAGLWADITNGKLKGTLPDSQTYVYEMPEDGGDRIVARVQVQNGLQAAQPYFLIVLADGLPIEFSVDGETYQKYSLSLSSEQQVLELEMNPDFSCNLGRLDFLLFFDGDPLSTYHLVPFTVQIIQEGEAHLPDRLTQTVPMRPGVQGAYTGGAYNAWLLESTEIPRNADPIGPTTIHTEEDAALLFEAIASREDFYRTILFLDGEVVPLNREGAFPACFDWQSQSGEMLQFPIQLDLTGKEEASFFTVSTPLGADSISQICKESAKIRCVADKGQ